MRPSAESLAVYMTATTCATTCDRPPIALSHGSENTLRRGGAMQSVVLHHISGQFHGRSGMGGNLQIAGKKATL